MLSSGRLEARLDFGFLGSQSRVLSTKEKTGNNIQHCFLSGAGGGGEDYKVSKENAKLLSAIIST